MVLDPSKGRWDKEEDEAILRDWLEREVEERGLWGKYLDQLGWVTLNNAEGKTRSAMPSPLRRPTLMEMLEVV